MKCGECGHENREGVLLCENCNSDIYDILAGSAPTTKLGSTPAQDLRLAEPPSSRPLMIYIADGSAPISVERRKNMILGRSDSTTSVDINLVNFNAQEYGVSRQHAKLNANEQPPVLIDLGSSNGTYINGQRLDPETPQTLESGDEIQLGRLKMRVYFK
ncbi:MAG: FHA domain-containing protein [Phototrophicaceae bacterium]